MVAHGWGSTSLPAERYSLGLLLIDQLSCTLSIGGSLEATSLRRRRARTISSTQLTESVGVWPLRILDAIRVESFLLIFRTTYIVTASHLIGE